MGKTDISIWYFNGLLLTAYGLMIGGYGIYELVRGQTAPVVLAHLHAPVWWGGGMLILGLFYCIRFAPGKSKPQPAHQGE
jgi:hypothetical protein